MKKKTEPETPKWVDTPSPDDHNEIHRRAQVDYRKSMAEFDKRLLTNANGSDTV